MPQSDFRCRRITLAAMLNVGDWGGAGAGKHNSRRNCWKPIAMVSGKDSGDSNHDGSHRQDKKWSDQDMFYK